MIAAREILTVALAIIWAAIYANQALELVRIRRLLQLGVLVLILMFCTGCAVAPNVNPRDFCTMEHTDADGALHCTLDEPAYRAAEAERKHLQTRQRWFAIGCDLITTVACIATGRGAELGGNATLLVKVPVGIWAQSKANEWDAQGNHTPYRVLSGAHLLACASNIVTCTLR